jgi:ketosteroid isomerase-like protein
MTDRAAVLSWLVAYEAAWRNPDTSVLAEMFTADASYLQAPYAQPVTGLAAIRQMWDAQRAGPDEVFSLAAEVVAVDGDTAVVHAEVHYGDPVEQEWRDLWVLHLGADGKCSYFEEWPFAPPRQTVPMQEATGL